MRKLSIIILLLLVSCQEYLHVGGTESHGRVVKETVGSVAATTEPLNASSPLTFWAIYIPVVFLVGFITYKTFQGNGRSK